jgi:hypothetical protein
VERGGSASSRTTGFLCQVSVIVSLRYTLDQLAQMRVGLIRPDLGLDDGSDVVARLEKVGANSPLLNQVQ